MKTETTSEESFFDNIKSTFIQRFSTPLYLYIITAFCVENWDKILYVAFGSGSIEVRTAIVQMQGIHIWQPIVYGLVLTIIMPFLSRLIDVIHLMSDWFYGKITYFRGEVEVNNISKLKLLEITNNQMRERKFAEHKALIQKIEAESKYATEQLEEKYRLAEVKFNGLHSQVSEYERMRDGFFHNINYGITFSNDIIEVLNNIQPHLEQIIKATNPRQILDIRNKITNELSSIDIDKIAKFIGQVDKARNKLPLSID